MSERNSQALCVCFKFYLLYLSEKLDMNYEKEI